MLTKGEFSAGLMVLPLNDNDVIIKTSVLALPENPKRLSPFWRYRWRADGHAKRAPRNSLVKVAISEREEE